MIDSESVLFVHDNKGEVFKLDAIFVYLPISPLLISPPYEAPGNEAKGDKIAEGSFVWGGRFTLRNQRMRPDNYIYQSLFYFFKKLLFGKMRGFIWICL